MQEVNERELPMRYLILTIVFASILAGCAGPSTRFIKPDADTVAQEKQRQEEFALRQYVEQNQRLYDVGWLLLKAGYPLCIDRQGHGIGLVLANQDTFGKDLKQAAINLYGMGERPQVVSLPKDGPAQAAGLQRGDILTSIDGTELPTAGRIFETAITALDKVMKTAKPFTVAYERNGTQHEATIQPVPVCDYPLNIVRGDEINAFADGNSINIYQGMMDFAHSDAELAEVIGHEFAHNAMRHIDSKRLNSMGGLLVDLAFAALGVNTQGAFSNIAGQAYSKEFEAEADYVGIYLMSRAGFPIDDSPNFWRRMGSHHPESIKGSFSASHPSTPERFVAIEATVEEIHQKETTAEPLLPNIDPDKLHKREPPQAPKIGFAPH